MHRIFCLEYKNLKSIDNCRVVIPSNQGRIYGGGGRAPPEMKSAIIKNCYF